MNTERLILYLKKLKEFPEPTRSFEICQTHISIILLTDHHAYKIKKCVDFGFLDYSTLEKRKHFCQREVELNHRLAPDLYLDVIPIYFSEEKGLNFQAKGELCEYAIKMNRFKETALERIKKGNFTKDSVELIADKVFALHTDPITENTDPYLGSIEHIESILKDNFTQADFFTRQHCPKERAIIESFSTAFLKKNRRLFEHRKTSKKIRQCHGDLRLDNIGFMEESLEIFDCIEFDDSLRTCDTASETAFFTMDLEFHGLQTISDRFVARYMGLSKDLGLYILLPFYKCYRAFVRGKVNALQSIEKEIPKKDREKANENALAFFKQAALYAQMASKKFLIIFCGNIASGKSTLAKHLADEWGLESISSDITRKQLAQLPLTQKDPHQQKHLYSESFSEKTYSAVLSQAKKQLDEHDFAILDATFGTKKNRHRAVAFAKEANAKYLFVQCVADPTETKRRLALRENDPTCVSDARLEHYESLTSKFEELDEIPQSHKLLIDSQKSMFENLNCVCRLVFNETQ